MNCQVCQQHNPAIARFCASCGSLLSKSGENEQAPRLGHTFASRYRIERVLGEGGMGVVFLARDLESPDEPQVAIKTLRQEISNKPEMIARFRREGEAVAALAHENIIDCLDFGLTPSGQPYIVTEYAEGRDLQEAIEEGPLPIDRVRHILEQVCGALEAAHAQGIVHRDLKPENIIVTRRDDDPDHVKLLDFGIALHLGAGDGKAPTRLTQLGSTVGTPAYMSPEQYTDRPVDARTDVYALAVIAYEMITGRLPFMASSHYEWATKHLTAAPTPMESDPAGAAAPEAVRAAIYAGLEKDPALRPASAASFLRQLAGRAGANEGRMAAPAPPATLPLVTTPTGRESMVTWESRTVSGQPATAAMAPASCPLPRLDQVVRVPQPPVPPPRRRGWKGLALATIAVSIVAAVLGYEALAGQSEGGVAATTPLVPEPASTVLTPSHIAGAPEADTLPPVPPPLEEPATHIVAARKPKPPAKPPVATAPPPPPVAFPPPVDVTAAIPAPKAPPKVSTNTRPERPTVAKTPRATPATKEPAAKKPPLITKPPSSRSDRGLPPVRVSWTKPPASKEAPGATKPPVRVTPKVVSGKSKSRPRLTPRKVKYTQKG